MKRVWNDGDDDDDDAVAQLYRRLNPSGHVHILKRITDDKYKLIKIIDAHFNDIKVTLNNNASILATVCREEGKVKLWDVQQGLYVRMCASMHPPLVSTF